MKILYVLILFAIVLNIPAAASAQTQTAENTGGTPPYLVATTNSRNTMAVYKQIPIRAVRNFKTTYDTIDNENWKVLTAGYKATFIENKIQYTVSYNRNGHWLSTVKLYEEGRMDADVRERVKMFYADYAIYLVEELDEPHRPLVYLVHMENKETYRNVRVCEHDLQTVLEVEKL
jgi:hypothetical protein